MLLPTAVTSRLTGPIKPVFRAINPVAVIGLLRLICVIDPEVPKIVLRLLPTAVTASLGSTPPGAGVTRGAEAGSTPKPLPMMVPVAVTGLS